MLLGFVITARGQHTGSYRSSELGIKSNLLYDATASINAGVEFRLSPRWSLDVSGNYNPFTFADNKKWKHWLVQPEARWWPEGAFRKHFLALHVLGGGYNIGNTYLPYGLFKGTRANRYEGWALGAGIGYGYRQKLGGRWSMEAEVGLGYAYSRYDRYECRVCGTHTGEGHKNYLGPTKLALSLVYTLPVRVRQRCVSTTTTITVRDTLLLRDTVLRDVPVAASAPRVPVSRVDTISFRMFLSYQNGSSRLVLGLDNNQAWLSQLSTLMDSLCTDSTVRIHSVYVLGRCSPEGPALVNEQVSRARARAVGDYILSRYPYLRPALVMVGLGEDWRGLAALVEHTPDVPMQAAVLDIIRNVPVYGGREGDLMRLDGGRPYRWMATNFFPQLRSVEVLIEYVSTP